MQLGDWFGPYQSHRRFSVFCGVHVLGLGLSPPNKIYSLVKLMFQRYVQCVVEALSQSFIF